MADTEENRESRGEAYARGYRLGFEAGRTAALKQQASTQSVDDALAALATFRAAYPKLARRSRPPSPKCSCGHVASSHNELGYCQRTTMVDVGGGKKIRGDCTCNYFDGGKAAT